MNGMPLEIEIVAPVTENGHPVVPAPDPWEVAQTLFELMLAE